MRFSDKLAKQRKNNNMSQEQLADKLGVSRQAVSKWESGSSYPDMDKIIQTCSILNCTLEDLLDDGVIKGEKDVNQTKNFNNYLQDFLSFITKSYNMFCSMRFKEKIKLLFEMALLIGILMLVGLIVNSVIKIVTYELLSILPEFIRYYLRNLINTVCLLGIIILGIIIILHIFKIRYLDYFVTIEDQNVSERKIEEPVEVKESKKNVPNDKDRIIIRDPKHSSFSFINLLGKLILYGIKFLALFIFIGVSIIFLIISFFSIFNLLYTKYGLIFLFIFVAILGSCLICYIIIELLYRFIFNIKQNFKRLFIMGIIGMIIISIGSGLFAAELLSYQKVDNYDDLEKATYNEKIIINEKTNLSYYYGDIEYIIDNNLVNEANIEITTLKSFEYEIYNYEDCYDIYINNFDFFSMYNNILNDIKNKTIRAYDSNDIIKIKITLSEQSYNYLKS